MKIFDKISINKPKRTAFDLSHERKFSMNMGDLVPILCQEVLPGDSFRLNLEQLVRLQPMLAPMMHRVNVYTHFFFVPNRIIWSEWEKFITGGENGLSAPIFPTFFNQSTVTYLKSDPLWKNGQLLDYMGIPVSQIKNSTESSTVPEIEFSQLPFRAYQTIYNEYYRDQNLQTPVEVTKNSGRARWHTTEEANMLKIRKRAWEKDYFTSALPFAQKGAQMELPITGEALIRAQSDGKSVALGNVVSGQDKSVTTGFSTSTGSLYADMENVSSTSVNELRQAFQIQKWLERNARGGTRYIEQIFSHFGVKSSDGRLQRPEYLGGGKTPVTISEVLQNSATEASSPQGNMAGHGVSVGSSHSFKRYFEEHGLIIGIMSVLPRTGYYQGLPKMFTKTDKYDYFWPEFAHLGEQEVKNKELYLNLESSVYNEGTFGYQPRYTEYRFIPDTVHGDFQDTLLNWHMARKFDTPPALNSDFVSSNPTHRVFAVTAPTVPKLLVNTYCNLQAIRPIPKYGNPGGI